MLRALAIRHFAIIDALDLDFADGFTAITGETGAGKSILIDALGLLLGDRADTGLIASGAKQAELEARFELAPDSEAGQWLIDQGMEEGQELIVRRILPTQGSSRAWINGRSATISQLAEIGALLVEIHGQHEHQQLEKPQTQRRLLDQRIDEELLSQLTRNHDHWLAAREALDQFEQDAGDPAQLELLRFQCRELQALNLEKDEFERLEAEQERLARSDEIRSSVARAANTLDPDDGPGARSLLLETLASVERLRGLDKDLDAIAGMLVEARINIDEALSELERFDDDQGDDPERLALVNQRLENALDLARKHRVQPAELPELTTTLINRLERLDNQDEQRSRLVAELEAGRKAWTESAMALSQARRQTAEALGKEVNRCLQELGMDQARLQITVTPKDTVAPMRHGCDNISIEFSANPGQALKSLGKVASGGELSRVSLALMIAARPRQGPVVRIFDEVDAGIGGETAHVVGRFLRQAAENGQAFCVTHLAQVASCADHQFRVMKSSRGNTTGVQVQALAVSERPAEIARMLGNAESRKSLEHARELLEQAAH
jgi:DNA repair protein RecN (Recombination protein N)